MGYLPNYVENKLTGEQLLSNKNKFLSIIAYNVQREGVDELIHYLSSETDFFEAPASSKNHGNYPGGLCEHSLSVYESLLTLLSAFDIKYYNKDTVAIVALFHDLCKANFYKIGYRNVKNEMTNRWESRMVYEIDDQYPLGHGEKSCIILQRYIKDITNEEMLAIRWHMGGFDESAKGGSYSINDAQNITPLCSLLQAADTLSANVLHK